MGRILLLMALAAFLLGDFAGTGSRMDPLEGFDRVMFALSDNLDKTAIKPTAQINQVVLPPTMQLGVSDFFANFSDIFIDANNLLQRNGPDLINEVGRILANTTLGVLGFLDIDSWGSVEKHERTSASLSAPEA
ncbi:MAG: MlaA family lipoprotein [Sterolibacterium sp.]|nr:MlaA family lipoprotein [Sterolibacterium sp.]